MTGAATTVEEYLAALPDDRREVVASVADLVRRHLPPGYAEGIGFGMITWSVPLERFADTYNGQPLAYVSLAAQKRHYALYLMANYGDLELESRFREQWIATGRRLDLGKSCLRFRSLDDLDLGLVGELVAAVPVDVFVERYAQARNG